ncbi:hypothetical protein C8J56DRAFT_891928 [Mycena floridula]|nr:hypothetical protein C8J56DRAFT_891928 [Mycena floridula]
MAPDPTESEDIITLRPNLSVKFMSETVRVMTGSNDTSQQIARNPRWYMEPDEEEDPISAWVAGACVNDGSEDAISGGGLWFSDHNNWNRSIRVPKSVPQTSQNGALSAALTTLQIVPTHIEIIFEAEHERSLNEMAAKLEQWENRGFLGLENKMLLQAIAGITVGQKRGSALQTLAPEKLTQAIRQPEKLESRSAKLI